MVDKVVYSFWSKPMNSDNVGFNSEEAFANCLKLSVFYSKKHFKEVQMITDSNGLRILKKWNIDVYFDDIRLDFDDVLKDVSINNWALGKIYACKIQDKPFIHIDNDVILFNKLSDIILKSECCFQNYEKNYGYYDNLLSSISDKEFKPEYIDTNINIALNCGVILFNNLSILNKWWLDALKCVDELSNLNLYNINLLFEQTYIYWLLISNKINITVLTDFDEKSKNDDYISDDYAKRIGYTHLISNSKRDPKTEEKIKNRLIKEGLFNSIWDSNNKVILDFIEIGTSNFDTISDCSSDQSCGISIEPLKYYLDKISNKINVKKINVALVDENIDYVDIFYIDENKLIDNDIEDWMRGCNSIKSPHKYHLEYKGRNLSMEGLVSVDKVKCSTFKEIMEKNKVEYVDYIKIDTEGYDYVILNSIFRYYNETKKELPKKIKFEVEHLLKSEVIYLCEYLTHKGYKIDGWNGLEYEYKYDCEAILF